MSLSLIIVTFIVSVPLAWGLTAKVRTYALRQDLLDHPNARSSHVIPTPRGGGLSIIIVMFISAIAAMLLFRGQRELVACLAGFSAAYASLGWLDDHVDLSAAGRFLVQLFLAALCVGWLGWGSPDDDTCGLNTIFVAALGIIWISWMANLYNFMDGIDGLAAIETFVLGSVTAIWFMHADSMALALTSIAVAGAAVGFLFWNWSPARVFMGDVGSVSLGAYFAILAIIGELFFNVPFIAFVVLYAVFLTDASVTLLRRVLRREKWWQAHRSHFYQRAVQSGWSHAQVSGAIFFLNLVLALIASLRVSGWLGNWSAVTLAAAILVPLMFLINSRYADSRMPGD